MIEDLVEDLWDDDLACFETEKSRFLVIAKSFPKNVLDFTLIENNRCIGYLTLLNNRQGDYYISYDPTGGVSHFDLSGRFGIGIEIAKEYRRRGFGHALLSIGIGFAIKDYKENEDDKKFKVIARGIGSNDKFYEKFGFELIPDTSPPGFHNEIAIYKKLMVPEIKIKE